MIPESDAAEYASMAGARPIGLEKNKNCTGDIQFALFINLSGKIWKPFKYIFKQIVLIQPSYFPYKLSHPFSFLEVKLKRNTSSNDKMSTSRRH